MVAQKQLLSLFLLKLVVGLSIFVVAANAQDGLVPGFYDNSCSDVGSVVEQFAGQYLLSNDPTLAPALLRMTFHDCFVHGCDASILLVPTPANYATEMTYPPNKSLRGFNVINAVKDALEEQCPGVVSCADIVQLTGATATNLAYGVTWEVLTGRRDGTVSFASEAAQDLPSPYDNITILKHKFEAVGLDVKDLAVLSAAHTVGVSHCPSFSKRLYNFSGNGDTDPSLDPKYAAWLKTKCPPNDYQTTVNMDAITPNNFDANYYLNVAQHRGLSQSDAALLTDEETNSYLESQVTTQGSTFLQDFGESMMKMYHHDVLTGSEGEIRKQCGYVN